MSNNYVTTSYKQAIKKAFNYENPLGARITFNGGSYDDLWRRPRDLPDHLIVRANGGGWGAPGLFQEVVGNQAAREALAGTGLLAGEVPTVDLDWPDGGLPTVDAPWWDKLLDWIDTLDKDGYVTFTCMGGHGRTGTALGIMLGLTDTINAERAVEVIRREYDVDALETDGQVKYLEWVVGAKQTEGQGSRVFRPIQPTVVGSAATTTGTMATAGTNGFKPTRKVPPMWAIAAVDGEEGTVTIYRPFLSEHLANTVADTLEAINGPEFTTTVMRHPVSVKYETPPKQPADLDETAQAS